MDEEVPELFCGERIGGVKGFFGQPDGEAGLGEIKDAHRLASQRGHRARGLISSSELMILGFIGDRFVEKLFWGLGALAESGTQVDFPVATQAGAEFAICGQADFITGGAEVGGGQGTDEANDCTRTFVLKVTGWTVTSRVVGHGNQMFGSTENLLRVLDGEEVFLSLGG